MSVPVAAGRPPRDHLGSLALWLLALVGVAVGVALWLLPASLHIVSWRDGMPGRVAFVAPPAYLFWSILSGALFVVAGGWWWRRRAWPVRTLPVVFAPLLLLLLWAVPYLPWLPGRVPLLMVLAGPVRWMVAALAVGGCVIRAFDVGLVPKPVVRWPGRATVLVVSLLVFVIGGRYVKSVQGFSGDEPHYLVVTHSLLADGDLLIENNHQDRDYHDFFPFDLPMHSLARGVDDQVYSIHAPGLPALMLPAYAMAGHWGALAVIGLIAALSALAIFDLAASLASRPIALATWAAVAFTIPFGLQSWLIYPEMPAALLMSWAVLWVWRTGPDRVAPWVWRGAALSLLPWLHTKYSLLLLIMGLWLAWRLWPRARLIAAFLTPVAVSGVLWLGSFYMMYGDFNPTVAYGYSQGAELHASNLPRGLLGLSFDQEFGLLPYSPIYLVALVGAWRMIQHRETRGYLIGLLLVVATFLVSVTQAYMWWGGASVPARFVVPILPVLAPMIAYAMHDVRGGPARGVIGLSLLLSVGIFVGVSVQPAASLMFNVRDGTSNLLEALQAGVPLTSTLPSLRGGPRSLDWIIQVPPTVVWVAAALVAALATRVATRRTRTGAFWGATMACLVFAGTGSLLATFLLDRQIQQTIRLGRQRLLAAYSGDRLETFAYDTRDRIDDAALFRTSAIETRLTGLEELEPTRLAGPFDLPPGQYDVQVWFAGSLTHVGDIRLSQGRTGILARAEGRLGNPEVVPLDLPVGLDDVWVAVAGSYVAAAVTRVVIKPKSVVPRRARRDVGPIWSAQSIGDRVDAYVFWMDPNTLVEPEANWVQGGRASELLVSPADAGRMRVVIRNGGADMRMTVTLGDQVERFELAAWDTRELAAPVPPGGELIPISVHPDGGYVPAEVVPGSTDSRFLCCTVTIILD